MIQKALCLVAVVVLSLSACAPETSKFTPPKIIQDDLSGKFLHHVYFWLKNPNSEADQKQLMEGLKTLTTIKSISGYHIGIPAGTPRDVVDNSYSVSWLLVFEDAQSQDDYQVDSIHEAFVKNYSHLWETVKVYDTKISTQ